MPQTEAASLAHENDPLARYLRTATRYALPPAAAYRRDDGARV